MLNLTEIKALLIELQKLSEEKNTDLFNFVAERIKAQLTPYALQKVCGTEEDIRKPQNAWNDERQMVERADSSAYDQLTYCLKASKPCDIRFVLDGKEYNLVQAQVGYGSGGFELVHDGHVYKIQKEGIISVHVDYA